VATNPYGAITDISGILVGQAERVGAGWLTGVTVVVPPRGTIGAVDVRGGGPGTRETDALAPGTLLDDVHAVTLAGGSAYGLAAAGGVQRWCEEEGRGFQPAPGVIVPIVPAAVVYDLGRGGDARLRPDAELGYEAARAATAGAVRTGCVGAGTGAAFSLPGLKGGVGTASIRLGGGVVVAALVVANAYGSPCAPGGGALLGAHLVTEEALRPRPPVEAPPSPGEPGRPEAGAGFHTTLAVVATNARLNHAQLTRMASTGHDGLARAVRPVHTLLDGDTVFALATGELEVAAAAPDGWTGPAELGGTVAVQAAAADAVCLAVIDAVLAATSVRTPAVDLPAYLERFPSARPPGYPEPDGFPSKP
jgi:putative pantetheine hydrolase